MLITINDAVRFANVVLEKHKVEVNGGQAYVTDADIANFCDAHGIEHENDYAYGKQAILSIPYLNVRFDCKIIRELRGENCLNYDIEFTEKFNEDGKPVKKRLPNVHYTLIEFIDEHTPNVG